MIQVHTTTTTTNNNMRMNVFYTIQILWKLKISYLYLSFLNSNFEFWEETLKNHNLYIPKSLSIQYNSKLQAVSWSPKFFIIEISNDRDKFDEQYLNERESSNSNFFHHKKQNYLYNPHNLYNSPKQFHGVQSFQNQFSKTERHRPILLYLAPKPHIIIYLT